MWYIQNYPYPYKERYLAIKKMKNETCKNKEGFPGGASGNELAC